MNSERKGLLIKCEEALNEYLTSDVSIKYLSNKYETGQPFLAGYLLGKNIDIYERKSSVNNSIFEVIDTEEKAYWLGFLYADGCVSYDESKNVCRIELSLMENDWDHLNKFKEFISYSKEIRYREIQKAYRIIFSSKKMCQDLIKNGCVPAKSKILKFPSCDIIPENLMRHFIRGYFDGDGCMPTKSIMSASLLGTEAFLTGVLDSIKLSDRPELKHDPRHSEEVLYIRFRTKSGYEFLSHIYEDCNIFLDRKMQTYKLGLTQNFKIFKNK